MKVYSNLSELADNYDVFVIDLWGVVHDGTQLYPTALEALRQLKAHHKTVIFLSNGPRRAAKVMAQLLRLGVPEDLYLKVVTSGEVGYQTIKQNFPNQPYLYIGPERDSDLLAESGNVMTEYASQAVFAVVTGYIDDNSLLDKEVPLLEAAKKFNLPLYCLNPDLVVVKQSGQRILCAGVVAKLYQQMGGVVKYFGKPHRDVYEAIAHLLKPDARTLAIGDAIETDIKGAVLNKLDVLLVTGGILQIDDPREKQQQMKIVKLLSEHDLPDVPLIARFSW